MGHDSQQEQEDGCATVSSRYLAVADTYGKVESSRVAADLRRRPTLAGAGSQWCREDADDRLGERRGGWEGRQSWLCRVNVRRTDLSPNRFFFLDGGNTCNYAEK